MARKGAWVQVVKSQSCLLGAFDFNPKQCQGMFQRKKVALSDFSCCKQMLVVVVKTENNAFFIVVKYAYYNIYHFHHFNCAAQLH